MFCDFPFWLKSKKFNLTFSIDFERLWIERRGYGYQQDAEQSKRPLAMLDYNGTKILRIIKIALIVKELDFPDGGFLNQSVMKITQLFNNIQYRHLDKD